MDITELGFSVDSSEIKAADKSLDKLESTTKKTEGATDRLNKENEKATRLFGGAGGAAKRLAGQLLAVVSAYQGIIAGIRVIREFEAAISAVEAVSRAVPEEMKAITQAARDLGATTSFSATQAADGMKFLAQAGFTARESVAAIPDVLNLARAGALDLASAADIASNVMSGFGIAATEAGNASDILAAISSRANTNVFQLGEAASFVGPVAAAMGVSLGDAAAAIGVLSDAGIQGSSAGTGLRRVLSSLANPTKEARDVIQGLGLDMELLDPASNNLVDVIGRLAERGLSAADALTIFGDRGGPAILALTQNVDRVGELANEMKNVDGEARRMADTMGDNLDGDIKELTSSLSELALQLGEAGVTGALRGFVQGMTEGVRVTGFLVDEIRAMFGSIADDDYVRLAERAAEIEFLMKGTFNPAQLADFQAELDSVRGRMEAIIPLTTETKTETGEWGVSISEVVEEMIEAAEQAEEFLDAFKDKKAKQALEELTKEVEAIKDAADPGRKEVRKLTEEFEKMREGVAKNIVNSEEWLGFLDYALPEVVVEAERLNIEIGKTGKAQKKAADDFDKATDRMLDASRSLFDDIANGADISFDGVLDAFTGLVDEMFNQAEGNNIFEALGLGGGNPDGGVLDKLSNLVRGNGEGGGLASLFSGDAGRGLAGAAGSAAGAAVFGETTGIGSTVGAAIGSIWGPVGTAVGSFLGSAAEVVAGDLFGFGQNDGNNQGFTSFDFNDPSGSINSEGVGKSFEQENVDSSRNLVDRLSSFANAIGGSDFSGRFEVGNNSGIEFINGSTRKGFGEDFEAAFAFGIGQIVEGAEMLDDRVKTLIRNFEGLDDELIDFSLGIISISESLGTNGAAAGFEAFEEAQRRAAMSATDSYFEQIATLSDLVSAYDGTADATVALNDALVATQESAFAMALGIETARKAIDELTADSAQSIRDSLLTEQEIFDRQLNERNRLAFEAAAAQDAAELQEIVAEATRLNTLLFRTLENPDEAQVEEFAGFADGLDSIANSRLDAMALRLEDVQQNSIEQTSAVLDRFVERQAESVAKFDAAVDKVATAFRYISGNGVGIGEIIV